LPRGFGGLLAVAAAVLQPHVAAGLQTGLTVRSSLFSTRVHVPAN
jgi:hypothetical protein